MTPTRPGPRVRLVAACLQDIQTGRPVNERNQHDHRSDRPQGHRYRFHRRHRPRHGGRTGALAPLSSLMAAPTPASRMQILPDAEVTGVTADMATAEGVAVLIAAAPDADILVNNVGTAHIREYHG